MKLYDRNRKEYVLERASPFKTDQTFSYCELKIDGDTFRFYFIANGSNYMYVQIVGSWYRLQLITEETDLFTST